MNQMLEAAELRPMYSGAFRVQSPRRIALLISCVVGILGLVGLVAAEGVAPRAPLAKGFVFVAASGLLLYALTGSMARRLMRAHALLAATVESMGDGMLVLGRDRRIVYANPAAVQMLECRSAANLVGIGAEEFSRRYGVSYMNGALVKPDAFASQRAFNESSPIRYRARMYPSPDHELVILVSAAPVKPHADEPAAMVVSVMHDITDAENLERDRDRLFAAAAHALKTPVAIIKANVQYMVLQGHQARAPSVAMIRRQCDRIDSLVQNLLIVSRARSKTLELHLRILELVPVVQAALDAMPDIEVRAEMYGSFQVRADEERLVLAITNLVHEARRDGVRGAPITLRLSTNAWTAQLAVQGKVVPVAERTFAEAGDHDDSKLSWCSTRTIVEAHGGTTDTDEVDGERTAWIRLPLVAEDDHDHE
jgi:PAS domain-containing protein